MEGGDVSWAALEVGEETRGLEGQSAPDELQVEMGSREGGR